MRNMPIGEMLKEYGYVTDEQIREALAIQKQDRSKKLGQILVEQGYISEKEVLDALGKRMGLQIIKLDSFKVDTNAVARIPKQLATKYNMIAIAEDESKLTVAMSDPLNFYAVEDVRQTTGMTLEVYLCESNNIIAAIDRYYAEITTKTAAQAANVSVDIPTTQAVAELEDAEEREARILKRKEKSMDEDWIAIRQGIKNQRKIIESQKNTIDNLMAKLNKYDLDRN